MVQLSHDLDLFANSGAVGRVFEKVGVDFFKRVGFGVEIDFVDVREATGPQELVLG
jgi:hypothetical protein